MPLTPRQIRGIRYKREKVEREKELDARATYGAIAGADLSAVYEANRSLVEGWMDNRGDIYGPGCRAQRPREAFPYSADADAMCASCRRTVAECLKARMVVRRSR